METSSIDGTEAQTLQDTTTHENLFPDSTIGICRICRGEATSTEPLFYPCKCSGSIKFVHQDCLMEWLSHSQKKYCELCKTPFRFTKLYAPDMPTSLPVHIFVEHMAKYVFRHVLVWLRAAMAISVWVFWLPYFMRAVWSFMFWISDDGLGSGSAHTRTDNATLLPTLPASILSIGTCPTSPLLAVPTTSVAEANALMGLVAAEDISDYLVRMILGSFGMPATINRSEAVVVIDHSAPLVSGVDSTANSTSLLGNVAILKAVTRSPTLNRAIVSVLEGQVITVLVIVSFILVILVRDYVVQQQPEINMRAAFAAPENNPPIPEQPNDIAEPHDDPLLDTDESASDDETLDDGSQPGDQHWRRQVIEALESTPEQPLDAENTDQTGRTILGQPEAINGDSSETSAVDPHSQIDTDGGSSSNDFAEGRGSVIEYLRIYRQAGGNLEEILRIVDEEGLQDELKYWIDVTHRHLKEKGDQNITSQTIDDHSARLDTRDDQPPSDQPPSDQPPSSVFMEYDSSQSSSLVPGAENKGKERALPPSPPDTESPAPLHTPKPEHHHLRSRSVSDGPHVQNSVNLLANNTWSFAALDGDIDQSQFQESNRGYTPLLNTTPGEDNSSSIHYRDQNGEFPSTLFGPQGLEATEASLQVPENTNEIQETVDDDETEQNAAPNVPANNDDDDDDANVGIVGRVANFMWGDLDDHQPADGQIEDIPENPEVDQNRPWNNGPAAAALDEDAIDDEEEGEDGEAAAAAPAFDAEAIEDMEDFEGVMELIGMRGPIAGLFQNAIFCAVLVSVTIFACIFIPYNIGRLALWVIASPMRVVRIIFELSKLIQDMSVILGGMASWFTFNFIDMFTSLIGGPIADNVVVVRKMSWALWTNASSRVMSYVFMDFPMTASEIQNFSAISHEALNTVKGNIKYVFTSIDGTFYSICTGGFLGFSEGTTTLLGSISNASDNLITFLMNPSSWVITLGQIEEHPPVNPELAHWSSLDRFWAIIAGYMSFFLLSALYLQRGSPFSRDTVMHAWEAGIIDTLQQASGIMKVILIISIEMLVFPLYCGLLLDAALLPLFEDTTFRSRMLFTYNYPMTSVFVHWFVGTGYMFHFALFVSMCRKIMRPGVLYFIRDPDDPEFHPVRDVLERNLTTQLRKILFSAFVYGALVIVCLGGVVWGLSFTMPGVLPIHYSSNEPVLEFPVDLLFYNFLMPLAVKFLKPSDALHTMYTWWFRQCARSLRLTYFLFGERRIDEEGTLQLPSSSPHRSFPTGLFLEVGETNTVIPKTWRDTFEGGDAKPNPATSKDDRRALRQKKSQLVESGQLVKSGAFVRAPANDRVKIPPGQKVFLPVSERGKRQDGQADIGLYASDQYQLVYIPPNFRGRIFVFILSIWVFAAVTGVGFTIIPLVFGRKVFKVLIPEHIRTNDIYAFSIGIFILGSLAYSAFHLHSMLNKAKEWIDHAQGNILSGNAVKKISATCLYVAKLAYAYFFLLIVFPLLASTMVELYLTIPLHTFMYPPTRLSTSTEQDKQVDRHTVRVIQAWTLGLLYLKLGSRLITSMFPNSPAASAVRSIIRHGWLQPDIKLLTRAFILPGLAAAAAAILIPPAAAGLLMSYSAFDSEEASDEAVRALRIAMFYRQSYPVAALGALLARNALVVANALDHWTAGVRDEAYLIGERLHNFGAGATGARKGKKMWGNGRQRL